MTVNLNTVNKINIKVKKIDDLQTKNQEINYFQGNVDIEEFVILEEIEALNVIDESDIMEVINDADDDNKDDYDDNENYENNDVNDNKEVVNNIYPLEWQGGKHTGTITERQGYYIVVHKPNNETISKYFSWHISSEKKPFIKNSNNINTESYKTKEEASKAAEKYRIQKSIFLKSSKNMWRKIDDKSIEIQICSDSDLSFFADNDNEIIEILKLHTFRAEKDVEYYAKTKKEKYYIETTFNGNKHTNFSKFLKPDIEGIITFKDRNPRNLRKSNLRIPGTYEPKQKMRQLAKNDMAYNLETKLGYLLNYISLPFILPKMMWILGKREGSYFEHKKTNDKKNNNDDYLKSFTAEINNYEVSKKIYYDSENKKKTEKYINEWLYDISYKFGQVKNLIKIINHKHIHVQISKNNILITNIELIPLIQQISLCTCRVQGSNKKVPYCGTTVNKKFINFHNLITHTKMTDHINGETLDNTMENLRACTYSINNANRHTLTQDESAGYEAKVIRGSLHIRLRIGRNKRDYVSKPFYFTEKNPVRNESFERELIHLKHIAFKYRQFILYGEWNDIIEPYVDINDCEKTMQEITMLMHNVKSSIVSFDQYFDTLTKYGLSFSNTEKTMIYSLYNINQNNTIVKYCLVLDDVRKRQKIIKQKMELNIAKNHKNLLV